MRNLLFLFFSLLGFSSFAQDLYLIQFTDKPSAEYYLENPEEMLSSRALDRRDRFAIDVDESDVPVEASYLEDLKALNINSIAVSKWFNGVFAWLSEEEIEQIEDFSFVTEVISLVTQPNAESTPYGLQENIEKEKLQAPYKSQSLDYGWAQDQIEQINLQALHNEGYTGEGIQIAILDNGFSSVDFADSFSYLRDHNQILDTYNFVSPEENVYSDGEHGTAVLSTIGGYLENQYIGTAIDADFYLFVTENNSHEMPDEEINWIRAAEKADSLGVDVINSSLGYYDFDDPRYNYTYEDMDGQTTYISRGAQWAAEKGIMVVNAAGNEGNNNWHYIGAPADAEAVFSIGAVDQEGAPASFSSYGPTADNRLKPDISAMGANVLVIQPNGVNFSNGTSFSSPIIAGAMACLIQANPQSSPETLRQRVRASADHYEDPTDQLGYGIPDFGEAYNQLLSIQSAQHEIHLKVYPNPTSNSLHLETQLPIKNLQLISYSGKRIQNLEPSTTLNISNLASGIYVLKIEFENGTTSTKRIIRN